jgi:hypothetical protein
MLRGTTEGRPPDAQAIGIQDRSNPRHDREPTEVPSWSFKLSSRRLGQASLAMTRPVRTEAFEFWSGIEEIREL